MNLNRRSPGQSKAGPRPNFDLREDLFLAGYRKIIGVDEVGRGAIAGPLVVAAVEIYEFLPGVRDSKLLTKAKRSSVVNQIHRFSLTTRFGVVNHDEIDALGLTAAQKLAYERAIDNLDADLFLTDFVSLPQRKYIKAVKGDQLFYPVAAASIVAKVYRDQLMSVYAEAWPNYGWQQNVGYGTTSHRQAIQNFGLSPLHRQTFCQ